MAGYLCAVMLVCCSVEDIFAAIENDPEPSATKYLVRASYLQIYNEVSVHLWQQVQTTLLRHAPAAINCAPHSAAAPWQRSRGRRVATEGCT
jgi:hypothetical protein